MARLRVRAFAVSTVVLMVLVAFQVAVQNRPSDPPKTADPPVGLLGPSSNPYLPSSQTLTNGTQTGGNCGSTWTDLSASDNVRCSYREVDKSPADQLGVVLLPDGTDVSGWSVSSNPNPKCATDATPHDELDEADPNDGDAHFSMRVYNMLVLIPQ